MTPQCSCAKPVVAEARNVDQLHIDPLAGRGHAHELTLVCPGEPHSRDDLVTGRHDVFEVHPHVGKRGTAHAKEVHDPGFRGGQAGRLLVLNEVVRQQVA